MELKSFDEFIALAQSKGRSTISVAAAQDKDVLLAVKEAYEKGIATAILIGDQGKIIVIAEEIGLDLSEHSLIDIKDDFLAAKEAVHQIRINNAQILMKGLINTTKLMKAVLDKEEGIRKDELISYLSVLEIPGFDRLFFVTDAAINIAPDYMQKVSILNNAIRFMHWLGYELPKVALLSANELISDKMPSTEDAGLICMMAHRGQLSGAMIDGPLALDMAVSKDALAHKGVISSLEGEAQLLLAPNIESANLLVKSMVHFAGGTMAGIVLGTQVPIIMTSRSDPARSKLVSIALASLTRE